jgi:hypothetical protein
MGERREKRTAEAEHDMCPMGCGYVTEDVAGGPCNACWNRVYDDPSEGA